MDGVVLPPELEDFVAEEVAAGRYRDLGDVVQAGIGLLRQRAMARDELLASVLAAEAEADRLGYMSGDDLLARVEARLARRAASAA